MNRIVSQFSLSSPHTSLYKGEDGRRTGEVYSAAQLQQQAALGSFSAQATDTFSIASMTLAGFAGRIARVGILSAGAKYILSQIGSVAAEAGTITLLQNGWHKTEPPPSARSVRQEANLGLLGDVEVTEPVQDFFKHFVNFGIFRLTARTGAACCAPTHHFIQSAAMMAGHQTAAFLNLEAHTNKSLTEQFIDANLSTLQISMGSVLAARLSAGYLRNAEKHLEQISSFHSRPHSKVLSRAALTRFRSEDREALLNSKLQEAYQNSSNFSTETLNRIDNCLRYAREINAARSSSGTFKDALLQHVLEGIAAIEDAGRRQEAFESLFTAMEMGLPQSDLESLVLNYRPPEFNSLGFQPCSAPFLSEHARFIPKEGASSWEAYSPQERNLLLNFIEHVAATDVPRARKLIDYYGRGLSSGRYDPDDIHRALTHAMASPLGEYILRRLTCILASEDHPGKLEELKDSTSIEIDEIISTQALIAQMSRRNTPPDRIAQLINHSRHTAYLNDLRVAEGIVRFYQRIYGQGNLVASRARARVSWGSTFTARILPRWKQNPRFTLNDLLEMMNATPNEQSRQLVADYQAGRFEIEVLDEQSFDARMRAENRVAQGKQIAFFMQRPSPQKPLILIRGFNIQNLQDSQNLNQLCANIIYTIPALIHEWEHARHFNGRNPFPASLSRGDRMATEALAYLEEYAWKIQFVDDNILSSTALLGMPPVTYFRSLADLTYYAEINQRLASQVIP